MAGFDGTWEAVDEENFKNYLIALDVEPKEIELFVNCKSSTLTIKHKGTEWTFHEDMDGDKGTETYKEGVERTITGVNGKKIKVTLKLESETKMVEVYNDPKYIMKTTREVTVDQMIETLVVNEVTAVTKYRRNPMAKRPSKMLDICVCCCGGPERW